MFVVVSYDIPDDKRRTMVCKLMKNYGSHTQYSVFECDLKPRDYQKLRQRLSRLIDKEEDRVRFYFLCQDDVEKIEFIGEGKVGKAKEYYLV